MIGLSVFSVDALKETVTSVDQTSKNLTAEIALEFPQNLTRELYNVFPGDGLVESGKSGLVPAGYEFPGLLELFYLDMLRNPGIWLVLVVLSLYLMFRITGMYIFH